MSPSPTDVLPGGPIETCLDELFDRLAGTGAAGRRSLAEIEDHLRAAADEATAGGAPRRQAEHDAVERLGSPAALAAELRVTHRGLGALVRPVLAGGYWIGVTAGLALGVSGLVSEVTGHLFGAAFVAADAPGVTYTPARCADYFEYFPHAASCAAAAQMHHWGEIVDGRVTLGVLALLGLGVGLLARRRLRAAWRPPVTLVALVIAALAAAAALFLLPLTLMSAAFGNTAGMGANLADGSAALLVAVGAAIWGVRRRTRLRPAS